MAQDELDVAVVGGGISGLALTWNLLRAPQGRPPRVHVFEASSRFGGHLRSERRDGFLCEWGPNGFLDNVPATLELVSELGLDSRLAASATESARRFVYRAGRLRELPSGPGSFLRSDVLPWGGKLRLLAEPFVPAARSDEDESVYAFCARRIGPAAAGVLVDAMVSGVFAGDVRRLSLRAAFPKMWAMEREHGGLFRAMWARRPRRGRRPSGGGPAGPGGRLTSFRDGFDELPRALAAGLGGALSASMPIRRLRPEPTGGYRLETDARTLRARAVVLACAAVDSAELVRPFDPELAEPLSAIRGTSLAVVHLGFERSAVEHPLDGFGFLVPRGEGPRILGTIWSSTVFPGRAPDGSVLLTTMIGGAHDPSAVDLDESALVDEVRSDLRRVLGLSAEPTFVRVFRHRRGIPQYELGHLDRCARVAALGGRHPALFFSGNSYRGVAVNACIEGARDLAVDVRRQLDGTA